MIGTQEGWRNQGEPSKMKEYSKRRGAKHLAENEGFKGSNGRCPFADTERAAVQKGSSYQKHLTDFPFSGALKGAAEKGQNAISWKVTSLTHVLCSIPIPLLLYY